MHCWRRRAVNMQTCLGRATQSHMQKVVMLCAVTHCPGHRFIDWPSVHHFWYVLTTAALEQPTQPAVSEKFWEVVCTCSIWLCSLLGLVITKWLNGLYVYIYILYIVPVLTLFLVPFPPSSQFPTPVSVPRDYFLCAFIPWVSLVLLSFLICFMRLCFPAPEFSCSIWIDLIKDNLIKYSIVVWFITATELWQEDGPKLDILLLLFFPPPSL